jgi:hypothetical protein
MDNEIFKIVWKNTEIGEIQILSTNMQYIDAQWTSYYKNESLEFEKLIATFDVKEVYNFPEKGTRVLFDLTNALVLGFQDNVLLLRTVYKKDAIDWLINSVH